MANPGLPARARVCEVRAIAAALRSVAVVPQRPAEAHSGEAAKEKDAGDEADFAEGDMS
jgi:hypothetical protein